MSCQSTPASGNHLAHHSVRIRRHIEIHGDAEIDTMVGRWRGVRIGIVDAISPVAIRAQLVQPSPLDEALSRTMLPLWRSPMLDRRHPGFWKVYDLYIHRCIS